MGWWALWLVMVVGCFIAVCIAVAVAVALLQLLQLLPLVVVVVKGFATVGGGGWRWSVVVVVGDDVAQCWRQVMHPTATAGFSTQGLLCTN
jgi:hypothetical protein